VAVRDSICSPQVAVNVLTSGFVDDVKFSHNVCAYAAGMFHPIRQVAAAGTKTLSTIAGLTFWQFLTKTDVTPAILSRDFVARPYRTTKLQYATVQLCRINKN